MIRAILKKGRIQPLDDLPEHWRDGQELIVEGLEPSDDPVDIKKWHEKLLALSAQIPANDHRRIAASLEAQKRQAKNLVRKEMGTPEKADLVIDILKLTQSMKRVD